ncbi:PMP22 claudin domain-containing protein [Rattus norvegicus]|uniref:Transmembrane protein 225 n=2 Tax=Rattus norvegicus TaxID=10116 RepID=TM225_RAT|nr:transmembrane protein 225 [Rattus norvegicus]Q6GV27.1 RecName: Full=Transmembrane protein 225 [Rattus norvegicus]AAT47558.1 PMP22 claudin domain-containing protein [Rattus norvegicus]EDL95220.1 PMP22 claudin domain-containing protein [Rattus norvegicus]|eukprot:NP_001019530.1 transmembrane protein 225 [Rattus norvegicus]
MMRIPNRSIQAANIFFSSGAILLLIAGLIMENWVELIPKVRKDKVTHSPWLGCCPPFWPEESLEAIRRMMMMSLNISIYLNLIIGLQFTYMISQNKCVHLLIGFLSFFTGCLLFYAIIVYHHKLNKGQYVYFVNYKTKWIVFTIYLTIALFLTCGIFSFIQCTNRCACMKFCVPHTESSSKAMTQNTIQVISLPPRSEMPRSIVHMHSDMPGKEGSISKPHLQSRRVTWAL